ncbi:MAG: hypothetical protein BWY50_02089 [Spirochaetes bacterium ADurb.Bin315]|nr:MAG: hypothetical protein BWY50_02089 [Spirochaetes bacterium ADurb.Bin315]
MSDQNVIATVRAEVDHIPLFELLHVNDNLVLETDSTDFAECQLFLGKGGISAPIQNRPGVLRIQVIHGSRLFIKQPDHSGDQHAPVERNKDPVQFFIDFGQPCLRRLVRRKERRTVDIRVEHDPHHKRTAGALQGLAHGIPVGKRQITLVHQDNLPGDTDISTDLTIALFERKLLFLADVEIDRDSLAADFLDQQGIDQQGGQEVIAVLLHLEGIHFLKGLLQLPRPLGDHVFEVLGVFLDIGRHHVDRVRHHRKFVTGGQADLDIEVLVHDFGKIAVDDTQRMEHDPVDQDQKRTKDKHEADHEEEDKRHEDRIQKGVDVHQHQDVPVG